MINAQPTNSKGKIDRGKLNQYQNQAKRLRGSFELTDAKKTKITKEVIEQDKLKYSGLNYEQFIKKLKQNQKGSSINNK